MKNRINKQTYFLRIFMAMLLVVCLPIIVFGQIFYLNSVSTLERQLNEQHQNYLNQVGKVISETLIPIESDIYSFRTNTIFFEFARNLSNEEQLRKTYDLSTTLNNFRVKYDMVHSLYLYNPEKEIVVTCSRGSFNVSDFYDSQWITSFNEQDTMKRYPVRLSINDNLRNLSHFQHDVQSVYTIAYRLNMNQLLAVNINIDRLMDMIRNNTSLWTDSRLLITNSEGVPIKEGDAAILNNSKYLQFSAGIPYDGWQATLYVPDNTFMEGFTYFRNYILIISFILLLFCLIVSYLLSRVVYKPINHLIHEISVGIGRAKNKLSQDDEVTYIRNVLEEINKENELMQDTLSLYKSMTRHALVRDFLQNKIVWASFLDKAEQIGLSIPEKSFSIIILDSRTMPLDENKKENTSRTISRLNQIEVLQKYVNQISAGVVMEHGTSQVLILLEQDARSYEDQQMTTRLTVDYHKTQEQLIDFARTSFGFGYYTGIGSIYNHFSQGPLSYQECLTAFSYAVFFEQADKVIRYNSIAYMSNNTPMISINIEAGLIRGILLKDDHVILTQIQEFIDYLQNHHLEDGAIQSTALLLSSLEKEFSFTEKIEEHVFTQVRHARSLSQIKQLLVDTCQAIVSFLDTSADQENYYVRDAKAYINDHYCQDMGVNDIANELGISYSYLCKLFKDHTQKNILEYLHEVRIEKAKELLKNQSNAIARIAQDVGYNNSQTFQRMFKKLNGITPGQFRKVQK